MSTGGCATSTTGKATIYDQAMDRYNELATHWSGDHRILFEGHDLLSAWSAVKTAMPNDKIAQEALGYADAIWKDVSRI